MWKRIFDYILKNYNVCTKQEFDSFILSLQNRVIKELANCKEIIDANNDGKISVYECWTVFKHLFKIVKIEVIMWARMLKA